MSCRKVALGLVVSGLVTVLAASMAFAQNPGGPGGGGGGRGGRGGFAFGLISIRSVPLESASFISSCTGNTPSDAPFSSITLTSFALI